MSAGDELILRKLRIDMAEALTQAQKDLFANIAIVLMEPKYPENIGAVARSAMNMGLSRLIVVRDEPPEQEKMLKMATHKAAHLIEKMELHDDLASALAPFSCVIGTTARLGGLRQHILKPRDLPEKVYPLLKDNQVALLFGPEHRGLTNDDLKYCQMVTNIPTADFSSLNLAQAVAIHCYELFSGIIRLARDGNTPFSPKIAGTHELEGMYEHVALLLQEIGFLKNAKCDYWMHNIRHFFGRMGLRAKEVRIIRGFCRQFFWYKEQANVKGKKELTDTRKTD
jgi:tRNA/rRNA methyltransferase